MKKKNILKELIIIFWIFIIGSVIGYIVEMIVVLFQKGYFESRQGMIYGPFTPVYGIGAVIYYLLLNNLNVKDKVKIFLITAVLGGITEYMCSIVQEKIFGTISWDYSHLMFDINGRTSLLHCTYWGIAGILYSIYIMPLVERLKQIINKKSLKIVTIVLLIFIIWDVGISWAAGNRQKERRKSIAPKTKIDLILDKYYTDEYMDKIYSNKREV